MQPACKLWCCFCSAKPEGAHSSVHGAILDFFWAPLGRWGLFRPSASARLQHLYSSYKEIDRMDCADAFLEPISVDVTAYV